MNPKLRRVLATIGFVFMSLFSISFVMYLVDKTLFGGRIWTISMAFLLPGIIIFAAIYITRGFPFQQLKDEEAAKQREEFIKRQALEAQQSEGETGDTPAQNIDGETQGNQEQESDGQKQD